MNHQNMYFKIPVIFIELIFFEFGLWSISFKL